MARYSRPAQLAQAMEADIIRRGLNVQQAVDDMVGRVYRDGYDLLSGTTSTRDLRRENHPYGHGLRTPKGRLRARRDGLPINVHIDRLRRSWRVERSQGGRVTRIGFTGAPSYAPYLVSRDRAGTRRMRNRGFWREITSRLRAYRLGIKQAMKGYT